MKSAPYDHVGPPSTPVLGGRLGLTLASPPPNCPGNPSCRPSQPLTLPPSQLQLGWAGKGTQGHLGPLSHSPALFPLEVAPGPHGSEGGGGRCHSMEPCSFEIGETHPLAPKGVCPLIRETKEPPNTQAWPQTSPSCSSCSGAQSPRGRQKGQK